MKYKLIREWAKPKGWLEDRFSGHYAQISTDTTLKIKSAAKDVARALLGHVPKDIEVLTHDFEIPPQGITDRDFIFGYDAGEGHVQGSIERDTALKEYIARYPEHWKIVQELLGLTRNKGKHASAFAIVNRPINEFIPLTSIGGVQATQYTHTQIEAVGAIKVDFLNINSLKDIQNCLQILQSRCKKEVPSQLIINKKQVPSARLVPFQGNWHDIWDLPPDQKVFNEIALGKTETVFQFNTPGAVKWLTHFAFEKTPGVLAIDSIEAMSAFTALDRPGPLDTLIGQHNMLVEYARRARGEDYTPMPAAEIFQQLLPETYALCCYQEQIQKVYQFLTGCTASEAETFRTYIAKKQAEKLNKLYPFFLENASKKCGEQAAKEIWQSFQQFGRYAFNKSHSVCYSIIGYACAWLKYYYPLEWWCAVLQNADKNEVNENFWRYISHLVNLPDITKSAQNWAIVNERLQAPVSLLHGVGEAAHKQLLAGIPYRDLEDFCQKIQDFKIKTATEKLVEKTDKKTGKTKQIIQKRLGTSALHRGVVYPLIISGAMDSLLKPGQDVLEQLAEYEAALGKVTGKKTESVKEFYISINQLNRYQLRKKILPAYSADLIPLILPRAEIIPELVVPENERSYVELTRREELDIYPLHVGSTIDSIENIHPLPTNLKLAVAGYVESWRKFNYGPDKKKEAVEIILDISGKQYKFVKWGGKHKLLPKFQEPKENWLGAIVIACISKFAEDRPFAVDELLMVECPLKEPKKED